MRFFERLGCERAERCPALAFFAAGAAALVVSSTTTPARSDESAYCRKVRARAAADAALLFAPSAQAQAIKFPRNGTVDSSVTTGTGFQFRAALTWSPLDFYKGFRVLRVGDADCDQHEAMVTAAEIVNQAADYARLPAARDEMQFLDSKQPIWQDIAAKSEQRRAASVTTLIEVNEIRTRIADLERKRAQVQGDVERLEMRGVGQYPAALSSLITAIEENSMRFEREASHVRSLDPWTVTATGGVIPQEKPLDYFGLIQVGYNLGGLVRNGKESRYLEARSEELRSARYELGDQLRRFRDQLTSADAQAKRELAIVNKQASSLAASRAALEHSETANAAHALAVADLALIAVESDRVFLTAWVAKLDSLQGDRHEH
jgi:hypothetical protein